MRHTTEYTEMIACVVVHSYVLHVAEGGELCLTSGDRREPEDSDVYIKPLPPRSAKPSEGEEEGWGGGCYSSGSLRSPEVKHNSPPSATLHKLSILSFNPILNPFPNLFPKLLFCII